MKNWRAGLVAALMLFGCGPQTYGPGELVLKLTASIPSPRVTEEVKVQAALVPPGEEAQQKFGAGVQYALTSDVIVNFEVTEGEGKMHATAVLVPAGKDPAEAINYWQMPTKAGHQRVEIKAVDQVTGLKIDAAPLETEALPSSITGVFPQPTDAAAAHMTWLDLGSVMTVWGEDEFGNAFVAPDQEFSIVSTNNPGCQIEQPRRVACPVGTWSVKIQTNYGLNHIYFILSVR